MAVYINNEFLSDEEAKLHVSDLSMQRGYAVFDFFRTEHFTPLFIDDHLDRFFGSATAMHLTIEQSAAELKEIILRLIEKSGIPEAGVRIMLTGGYSADSYKLSRPNLVITCKPGKVAGQAEFEKGYKVITHPYQRELPQIKSIHYQMAVWLQPLLMEKAADDVLYYNDSSVTECPRSNIFMITKENILVTPAHNILKGVTRKNILAIAQRQSLQLEERNIPLEELYDATEIFITSTTKKIIPVLELDGHMIGDGKPGAQTRLLLESLNALQRTMFTK